jgi:hypothetical protein
MGKKGNSIPCPFGGSKKKKQAEAPAEGSGIIVGAVQVSEARYVTNRIEKLQQALDHAANGPNGMANEREEANAPANVDPNNMELDDNYVDNFLPHAVQPDDPEVVVLPDENIAFSNYIRGSYYKSKRLAEKRKWEKNLPDMFISYMTLSQKTLQWGDTSKWDHDFHQGCCCGVSAKITQKVDMLDILSAFLAFLLSFHIFFDKFVTLQ